MKILITVVLSVSCAVAAQFALKAGISGAEVKTILHEPLNVRSIVALITNKFVLVGLALYVFGVFVWLHVLSVWDVSKAYPLVGLGFAFTAAIGWVIGEQVTFIRALGVALICVGVALVGRS